MEGMLSSCWFLFVEPLPFFFFTSQAEQNSVSELQTLLTRTIEALSFVLLLSDYRLGELIAKYAICIFAYVILKIFFSY
jgi:hypothetical protein